MAGAAILVLAVIGFGYWATTAPLATTIRANGKLISAHPSTQIQHKFGGRIAQIYVTNQQDVAQGELLLRLDVEAERQELKEIQKQISYLNTESEVIAGYLHSQGDRIKNTRDTRANSIYARYLTRAAELDLNIESSLHMAQSRNAQSRALKTGIAIKEDRLMAHQLRLDDLQRLQRKGHVTEADYNAQSEQLLSLEGEINSDWAEFQNLVDQSVSAKIEANRLELAFQSELLAQQAQNDARMPELKRQEITFAAQISAADIRAPHEGKIVSLPFNTNQMVVQPSQTILEISRALEQPSAEFNIPTQAIDQLQIGQIGQLTIPSLPQRNLPRINVRVSSISPTATKDADGAPIGYTAQAAIELSDLEAVKTALGGDLSLSADMPVAIAIEGRKITFSQYLVAPFFAIFNGALQD